MLTDALCISVHPVFALVCSAGSSQSLSLSFCSYAPPGPQLIIRCPAWCLTSEKPTNVPPPVYILNMEDLSQATWMLDPDESIERSRIRPGDDTVRAGCSSLLGPPFVVIVTRPTTVIVCFIFVINNRPPGLVGLGQCQTSTMSLKSRPQMLHSSGSGMLNVLDETENHCGSIFSSVTPLSTYYVLPTHRNFEFSLGVPTGVWVCCNRGSRSRSFSVEKCAERVDEFCSRTFFSAFFRSISQSTNPVYHYGATYSVRLSHLVRRMNIDDHL